MFPRNRPLPLLACLAGLAAATAAPADEADVRRCLSTRSMQNTYVLNDNNILFVRSKKRMYLNVLPSRCPGLGTYGSFSYSTTTGSLCSSDPIRVTDRSGHDNQVCRLGEFRKVTREEIAAIVEGPDQAPKYGPPPAAEPETVIDETDAAGDAPPD